MVTERYGELAAGFPLSRRSVSTHSHFLYFFSPFTLQVAQRAFGFCERFQRKNEFGRLVDQLRRHFNQSIKYQNQANSISLENPVTLQLLLETRFEQLNTAIKMDLWKVRGKAFHVLHVMRLVLVRACRACVLFHNGKLTTLTVG